MVRLITPTLRAASTIRDNTANVVQFSDWDFSVRAPIGIVVNRVTLQVIINDVSGIAASEFEMLHAVSMDPDDTAFADVYSTTALFDVNADNIDKLSFQVHQFDGQASASGGAAGMQVSPYLQLDWYGAEVLSRPVTFRNIRHMSVGTVNVEAVYLALLEYQLGEFTQDEVSAFAATRA